MSKPGFVVLPGPILANRTTMHLGGQALAEIRIDDPLHLDDLPEALDVIGGRAEILGGGSNIIAADGELPLTLLTVADKEITPGEEVDGRILLHAQAGARLPALLNMAARCGLSGLEGLAGIPGSVGGALSMNAGSYGVEVWSAVSSVQIFSLEHGVLECKPSDFTFGYRHCRPVRPIGLFLFTAATFALTPGAGNAVREKMRALLETKRSTQPVGSKSAGCVFKNPEGASAGKLLDAAGMKGKTLGGMSYSPVHANFMVNSGRGTSAEALELLELGREAVWKTHGIRLETEVRLWP